MFGVGYYYTHFQESRFSGLLGVDDHGQGFETFYNAALTPAAHLTFDVQLLELRATRHRHCGHPGRATESELLKLEEDFVRDQPPNGDQTIKRRIR